MELAYKVDSYGKPAWIVLTVLAFMAWWPLGLALLAFAIGSGRFGCGRRGFSRWQEQGADAMRNGFGHGFGCWTRPTPSSGNRAFDEYRQDTLRRLEEEQKEFKDFLERLRQAKDKAEFDQFMADRRRRSGEPDAEAPSGN
ncbi:DUF2852 domain-containing protein [Xanthobacter autotrophicus DSM 431]|uniref:DUF2852 domain-containing protein n=1 Tax=Xanthobacter nonsaccharivorans TaxID=3119912 RepID=UPI00372C801D